MQAARDRGRRVRAPRSATASPRAARGSRTSPRPSSPPATSPTTSASSTRTAASIKDKIETVAKRVYGADEVVYYLEAEKKIEQFTDQGLGRAAGLHGEDAALALGRPGAAGRADRLPASGARRARIHGRRLAGAALRRRSSRCPGSARRPPPSTSTSTPRDGPSGCSRGRLRTEELWPGSPTASCGGPRRAGSTGRAGGRGRRHGPQLRARRGRSSSSRPGSPPCGWPRTTSIRTARRGRECGARPPGAPSSERVCWRRRTRTSLPTPRSLVTDDAEARDAARPRAADPPLAIAECAAEVAEAAAETAGRSAAPGPSAPTPPSPPIWPPRPREAPPSWSTPTSAPAPQTRASRAPASRPSVPPAPSTGQRGLGSPRVAVIPRRCDRNRAAGPARARSRPPGRPPSSRAGAGRGARASREARCGWRWSAWSRTARSSAGRAAAPSSGAWRCRPPSARASRCWSPTPRWPGARASG